MFVGHALFAFAFAAGVGAWRADSAARALAIGAAAGLFAAAPDVDIVYAFVGLLGARGDALSLASSFWATGNVVHRAVTHSLVVAPVVALAAGLWVAPERTSLAGRSRLALALALAAALVGVAGGASGPLGGGVMALFVAAVLAIAEGVRRYTSVDSLATVATALFGVASHPFGDLFTGTPPAVLYPLDAHLFTERVALAADPTMHLLAAFGVELAVVWAAVAAFCWLTGVRPSVERRATLGAGYAASVFVIPAPTLDLSYPFVFSVLAVGALGVFPNVRLRSTTSIEVPGRTSALVTGLTAVTVAWAAYASAYLAL